LDPQVIQIARADLEQMEKGGRDMLGFLMGPLNQPGAAGYTRSSQGVVVTHMQGSERVGKRFQLLQGLKDSLEQTAAYARGEQAHLPFSTIGAANEQNWIVTLFHEVGHQVHYRGLNAGSYLGSEHFKKGGWASVSHYGLTNERERFAEAFVQYTFNPEGLKRHAPGLYSWVDEALRAALK
jgi:hypothetical protein